MITVLHVDAFDVDTRSSPMCHVASSRGAQLAGRAARGGGAGFWTRDPPPPCRQAPVWQCSTTLLRLAGVRHAAVTWPLRARYVAVTRPLPRGRAQPTTVRPQRDRYATVTWPLRDRYTPRCDWDGPRAATGTGSVARSPCRLFGRELTVTWPLHVPQAPLLITQQGTTWADFPLMKRAAMGRPSVVMDCIASDMPPEVLGLQNRAGGPGGHGARGPPLRDSTAAHALRSLGGGVNGRSRLVCDLALRPRAGVHASHAATTHLGAGTAGGHGRVHSAGRGGSVCGSCVSMRGSCYEGSRLRFDGEDTEKVVCSRFKRGRWPALGMWQAV